MKDKNLTGIEMKQSNEVNDLNLIHKRQQKEFSQACAKATALKQRKTDLVLAIALAHEPYSEMLQVDKDIAENEAYLGHYEELCAALKSEIVRVGGFMEHNNIIANAHSRYYAMKKRLKDNAETVGDSPSQLRFLSDFDGSTVVTDCEAFLSGLKFKIKYLSHNQI